MDCHSENWDEVFPHRNHDYYGNHSIISVLQAMTDGPRLPARACDAKNLKIQVSVTLAKTKAANGYVKVHTSQFEQK